MVDLFIFVVYFGLSSIQFLWDECFYGLQGLPCEVLYRVCRYDEDINRDINCKAPPGTEYEKRTPNQHINSGSKYPSRFISTTTSLKVAKHWAGETWEKQKNVMPAPPPIIKIYLSRMTGMIELENMINLSNPLVFGRFISGAIQINRVKSSDEILFQWRIPKKNYFPAQDGSLVEVDVFELCTE